MKNRMPTVALIGLLIWPLATAAHSFASPERASPKNTTRVAQDYGKLPMSFQPNRGQFEPNAKFASRGFGYSLSINSTGLQLRLHDADKSQPARMEMQLLGANPNAQVRGISPLPGEANYFSGSREDWITHVPTYEKVRVDDIYPGIDAVYYGTQNRLEYDFVIAPGASPNLISLEFPGSTLAVNADGDLLISSGGKQFRQAKPTIYQDIQSHRISIAGKYFLIAKNRVGFEVSQYNHSKPLVIDPQVIYAILGELERLPTAVAVDSLGNVYLAGSAPDSIQADLTDDAYVAKINSTGTSLLWSNTFGVAFANDDANAVTVDASGNVYVTGRTDGSYHGVAFFPEINPIQPIANSGGAFITKFDTNGEMVYSSTLGGSNGLDVGTGVAVDHLGNMYITGFTGATNLPIVKPFQSSLRGGYDVFVSVLNPQGSAFIFSTYLGGSGDDFPAAITVDATGNSYVTGRTNSPDFPTVSPIRGSNSGGFDAFVFKLNPAGSALQYSTYLGGSSDDSATGIAVDSSGNAYVAGSTSSPNFPVVNPLKRALSGPEDAFAAKINSSGTALVYSTYLGGSNLDEAVGITVNLNGNAYVAGTTTSPDFYQVRSVESFVGVEDAFVTELSPDGAAVVYSTLLGGAHGNPINGSANTSGAAIASDSNGRVYILGITTAEDFPITGNPTHYECCPGPPGFQGIVGFIVKLMDDSPSWARVEETSTQIQYTGTWSPYSSPLVNNSGGHAVLAQGKGARATFTFTGTAARWIGYTDQWSGIANVYVDGAFKQQVDTYSSPSHTQVILYSISGLTAATHTLAVEVAAIKDGSSQSDWVWVDAFEYVPGGTATTSGGGTNGGNGGGSGSGGGGGTTPAFTRVEQNGSAVAYTGTWYGSTSMLDSGGSAVLAIDKGSRAAFTFTGTEARWIGYKDAWSGIANVYVDGVLKTQVDDYSASSQAQAVLYTISGLTAGTHTLTVEVSGTKNASSQSFWIWVDAFDYASGTGSTTGGGGGGGTNSGTFTRVQQNSPAVTYSGTWYSNAGSSDSGGSAALAIDKGSRATFTFTGTTVKWIGYRDAWSGIANVYIDGALKTQVDTYSASSQFQVVNFMMSGLSPGMHTLTIEVTGTKNSAAQSSWVWVDAFDYQ